MLTVIDNIYFSHNCFFFILLLIESLVYWHNNNIQICLYFELKDVFLNVVSLAVMQL